MQGRTYYVYLLTNWNNKVLYVGVTNNLERRIFEHKSKLVKGFTHIYNVNKLVYFEGSTDIFAAIAREKKNKLVTSINPKWRELNYIP